MRIIYSKGFLLHDTGMHPENKKRLLSLGEIPETEIISGEPYLELVHDRDYIEHVKDICGKQPRLDQDTVVSADSYKVAQLAVGATIMASNEFGFALVRPPGHHAYPNRSSGFCIFNNISIAAKKLANEGKKVLIFDFDGHLGDGTVRIFHDSDRVMYWSIHQFPAFPGGGDVNDIGEGKGEGYTINVPLPPGSGDDIYMRAIDRILPIAKQFNPDVVAVSAGFDAHQYDLLLELRLSSNMYHKIGSMIRENFKNSFATLEGGYNIEILPNCLYNFLAGMNGEEIIYKEMETDSMIQVMDEFEARMYVLMKNLSKHWRV